MTQNRHDELVDKDIDLVATTRVVVDQPLDPELLAVDDGRVEEISPFLEEALHPFARGRSRMC